MSDLPAADLINQKVKAIQSLRAQVKDINEEIKEEYADAKAQGLDVPVLKALIAELEKDPEKLEETRSMIEIYRDAVA